MLWLHHPILPPAGFSLTALEQLLAENQQLAATAAAAQQQAQQQAPSGEAAQQLEAQLRQARLENEALRQQLRRSESLRRKGQRALYELHQVRWGAGRRGQHKAGMRECSRAVAWSEP